MSPLKATWPKIYPPLVEQLKLQVRMNVKQRAVELRTSRHTQKAAGGSNSSNSGSIVGSSGGSALQKGEDFVRAFALGFDVDDALALLRLDDLYIETFEVKDVRTLHGAHLGRAVGRIAGKDGKMKFAIENASRTRVVLADQKIHILGGFRNIHIAREAIVSLILGSPPVCLLLFPFLFKIFFSLLTFSTRFFSSLFFRLGKASPSGRGENTVCGMGAKREGGRDGGRRDRKEFLYTFSCGD
jgi:RNA-binding protein PNO1